MAPTSYQPPTRGDWDSRATYSQTAESTLRIHQTPVSKVLAGKSGEICTIGPDQTILDAVQIMRDKRIGALLVTNENGDLLGVLSERDIVRKMADIPGRTLAQKVSALMAVDYVSCSPEDNLVMVLQTMTDKRTRHMPVMEGGRLTGIITIGDVVHFRLKELEYDMLKMKQMIVG